MLRRSQLASPLLGEQLFGELRVARGLRERMAKQGVLLLSCQRILQYASLLCHPCVQHVPLDGKITNVSIDTRNLQKPIRVS